MKNNFPIYPKATEMAKHFGNVIRDWRLKESITMDQMSQKAGFTENTLRSLEDGNTSVSIGKYLQVLFLLKIENEFFTLMKDSYLKANKNKKEKNSTPIKRASKKGKDSTPRKRASKKGLA